MALSDAKWTFNRLIFSLVVVTLATLTLSYFLSLSTLQKPITGQFILNQSIFMVAVVIGFMTVGVVLLRKAISR
jgi:hypothetical protein